ncbi:chromosomal replication initiator protein DnaA [Alysiella crassa]|uniref:Chromosomal replication initiator protein DnaA n=1 Tax=Alysiella crassa TaxID=153491 RepID=A0A376BKL7_9NEIS|nr:chromosomal replication initiator protein DnaA [Alysiella crassa]SSY70173.1 Chromosomal replication initiator protein DnaA [Alysiella crassa]
MILADFWAQTLRRLHSELSEQQFNLAIAPITVGEEGGAWVIYAKNQFAVNLLRSQYAAKLAAIRAEIAPNAPELAYKVGVGMRYEMADEAVSGSLPVDKLAKEEATHAFLDSLKLENPPKKQSSIKKHAAPVDNFPQRQVFELLDDVAVDKSSKRKTSDSGSLKTADKPPSKRKSAEKTSTKSSKRSVLGALGNLPLVSDIDVPIEDMFELTETVAPPETKSAPKRKHTTAQDILAERMNNLRPSKKSEKPSSEPSSSPKKTNTKTPAIEAAKAKEGAEQRHVLTNLSPEYTFDTLVEGKGNHLAAAVAKSIAEKPGDSMYNPFFVYGSTGLGKTHLVQAIANEFLRLNPKARVRYMHSDEYLKTFMTTVRNKTWDSFKQQYLHYNLLIIDDIQFIQGKDRTMEEFFFLFEHFHSRNQQIILTCDQLPSSLENMEKRLVSRFSWGMTIKLEPPELEMRVDILERKAAMVGVTLSEDASMFIAQNVKQNVRELEGALNRVLARCRFEKRNTIDLDLATEALQDIVTNNHKGVTVELIMKAVADFYHLRISDLLGKKRTRNIARPRQMAMALSKELTNMSLPAIGDAFAGRDHTTVLHAIKTITKLRVDDPELGLEYEKLLSLAQDKAG